MQIIETSVQSLKPNLGVSTLRATAKPGVVAIHLRLPLTRPRIRGEYVHLMFDKLLLESHVLLIGHLVRPMLSSSILLNLKVSIGTKGPRALAHQFHGHCKWGLGR